MLVQIQLSYMNNQELVYIANSIIQLATDPDDAQALNAEAYGFL